MQIQVGLPTAIKSFLSQGRLPQWLGWTVDLLPLHTIDWNTIRPHVVELHIYLWWAAFARDDGVGCVPRAPCVNVLVL